MKVFWIKMAFAVLAGVLVGYLSSSFPVGVAVFAAASMAAWVPIYIRYAQDNPGNLWFKRKLFGWGWTPVTWQGWAVIIIYAGLVAAFAATIDENSPPREVAFTFILPVILLSILLVRIAYGKGEKPKWQWGKDIEKYD